MSVDLNAVISQGTALDEAPYAALAWQRIQHKPSVVNFKTAAGASVGNQTIRIENDSRATPSESGAGVAPRRRLILFGVKNHATVTDTDFKEGYRLILDNAEYRILGVNDRLLGERQATAEKNG